MRRPNNCPLKCGHTFITLDEARQHFAECPKAMVKCPDCKESVHSLKFKQHQEACGKMFEPCVQCNQRIKIADMQTHIEESCPMTLVRCNTSEQKIPRKDQGHDCIAFLLKLSQSNASVITKL